MSTSAQPRSYDSSGRRAQALANRERILRCARDLFLRDGFAATSVADIARTAGVSAPTVFSAFGSKVNLLKEAAETTVVGDARPVPMAERTEMHHIHAGRTAGEVLDRLADLVAQRAPEVFPIFAVMYAARDGSPEIAALADSLDAQRLVGAEALAHTVADRAAITDPPAIVELRDGIWAAMSLAPYDLLVVRRGWTIQQYRLWVRAALQIPLGWA